MAEPNWKNKTIWTGDNLEIMRGMNSESIDLIYLDPPFNSKADYAAPIGSKAAGAAFKDTWSLQDVDVAWLDLYEAKLPKVNRVIQAALTKSDKSYLIYMAIRILEMHRILKPTGSIYLHCDPTMSHYLKLLMDAIFGRGNFRNEIVWCYTGPGAPNQKQFSRKHDTILWYSNGDSWRFNSHLVRVPHKKPIGQGGTSAKWENDNTSYEKYLSGKIPESWWTKFSPVGRIKSERVGYPTQKPVSLLERIIKASSNENDIVFDPFCGCATTLVAADRHGRNWVGIDISDVAVRLVKDRMKADQRIFKDIIARTDIPKRNDLGELPKYNSTQNKRELYGIQQGHCNGCKEHFHYRHLEVDHVIARAHGGGDHLDNLQLLCGHCNSVKGDRGMEYLLAKLTA